MSIYIEIENLYEIKEDYALENISWNDYFEKEMDWYDYFEEINNDPS